MLDAVRGWRIERELRTTDTSGRPVTVTCGLTKDASGEEVVGLAVTAAGPVTVVGPSAVLTLDDGSQLVTNLRLSLADLLKQQGGAR